MVPPPSSIEAALVRLRAALSPSGLDRLATTSVGRYNQAVPSELRLPDLGDPRHAAIVIGSADGLWPAFLRALRESPEGADRADPLDHWLHLTVTSAVRGLGLPAETRLSHEPPPRRFAAQRLAHLAGLAHLGPAHLSIHPEVGPWLAIRAAVVLPLRAPDPSPPAPDPCTTCPKPCLARLEAAIAASTAPGTHPVRDHWRAWLAVRDACPEGRPHRYPEDQIAYHYTADRTVLRKAIDDTDP